MDWIFEFVSPERIILFLLGWNTVGAYYHYKWEKSVNSRLAYLEENAEIRR